MKNLLSIGIGILIGIFLTTSVGVFASVIFPQDFPDVSRQEWYSEGVYRAQSAGRMMGYTNGMFGPADAVTRAQLATIFNKYNERVDKMQDNLKTVICTNRNNATNNTGLQFKSPEEKASYEKALEKFCESSLPGIISPYSSYDAKTGEYGPIAMP